MRLVLADIRRVQVAEMKLVLAEMRLVKVAEIMLVQVAEMRLVRPQLFWKGVGVGRGGGGE